MSSNFRCTDSCSAIAGGWTFGRECEIYTEEVACFQEKICTIPATNEPALVDGSYIFDPTEGGTQTPTDVVYSLNYLEIGDAPLVGVNFDGVDSILINIYGATGDVSWQNEMTGEFVGNESKVALSFCGEADEIDFVEPPRGTTFAQADECFTNCDYYGGIYGCGDNYFPSRIQPQVFNQVDYLSQFEQCESGLSILQQLKYAFIDSKLGALGLVKVLKEDKLDILEGLPIIGGAIGDISDAVGDKLDSAVDKVVTKVDVIKDLPVISDIVDTINALVEQKLINKEAKRDILEDGALAQLAALAAAKVGVIVAKPIAIGGLLTELVDAASMKIVDVPGKFDDQIGLGALGSLIEGKTLKLEGLTNLMGSKTMDISDMLSDKVDHANVGDLTFLLDGKVPFLGKALDLRNVIDC